MGVNLAKLISAYMNMDPGRAYFLDVVSGEILSISISSPSSKELQELSVKIQADKKQYLKLPRRSSADNYKDMEEFIPTLTDQKLKQRLSDALRSGGTISKFFRDSLAGRNFESENWIKFKRKKIKDFIISVLKGSGVKI